MRSTFILIHAFIICIYIYIWTTRFIWYMIFSCIYNVNTYIYVCISLTSLRKLANLDSFYMAIYKVGNLTANGLYHEYNFSVYFICLQFSDLTISHQIFTSACFTFMMTKRSRHRSPPQPKNLNWRKSCSISVQWRNLLGFGHLPVLVLLLFYVLGNVCALKNWIR